MEDIIKGIGAVTIFLAIIAFLAVGIAQSWGIGFGIAVAGAIQGVLLMGFGEVIELLRKSTERQNAILDALTTKNVDVSRENVLQTPATTVEQPAEKAETPNVAEATVAAPAVNVFPTRSDDEITCRKCGKVQKANRNCCWKCGDPFVYEDEQ